MLRSRTIRPRLTERQAMIRRRVGLSLMGLCLCAQMEVLLHAQEQAGAVRVFNVGDGVSAAELLPATSPELATATCKSKSRGVLHTEIGFVVDNHGEARNLSFLKP